MSEVTLNVDCLLSKFGFGDGDVICDWWDDRRDDDFAEWSMHATLQALVRRYLIPEIEKRGHTIEVYDIVTIHNPIRARRIDGKEVEPRGHPVFDPPIKVVIPADVVLAAIESEGFR